MCVISQHVNRAVRYHDGQAPKRNKNLRALFAAQLLRDRAYGVNTITAAAIVTNVTRPAVKAALLILQAEADLLATDVLERRVSLLEAGKVVRIRAQLITTYKAADRNDRAALGEVVGVDELFDEVVAPSLI